MAENRGIGWPNRQTLQPFNAPMHAAQQAVNPTLLGGLTAIFAQIFARATPPPELDTDIELRQALMTQQAAVSYGTSSAYEFMRDRLVLAQTRKKMYDEYEDIENDFPEVSSALDIYADNVCSTDSFSEDIVSIQTDDVEVGALFMVLKDILKLDSLLWTRAREITRAGEAFDEIVYGQSGFIERVKSLTPQYMVRNDDPFGLLPFDQAFTQVDDAFKPEVYFGLWQVLHYRLLRRPDDKYGTGLLFAVRRLAKKLSIAEDALMIARLTRAHKKLIYKIPTDGMSPDERRKYINDTKREFRKRRVINPRTQRLDIEANPLASEDDIFLGTTKENPADVQEVGGDSSVSSLADIEFWQNKLFSALKVPKAYIGIERDVNAKATLTEQDVQFARTVHRIQMSLQFGIREMFERALVLFGRDPRDTKYTLSFPAISLIDELRNWEIENMKLQAAFQFADLIRPDDLWMLVNYLGFTAEEAAEILANQKEELPPPGQQPPPTGAEGGAEEEQPEESRRFDLEKLFERGRGLQVMGQRSQRRQTFVERKKEYQRFAERIKRNGRKALSAPTGSGF